MVPRRLPDIDHCRMIRYAVQNGLGNQPIMDDDFGVPDQPPILDREQIWISRTGTNQMNARRLCCSNCNSLSPPHEISLN